MVNYTANKWKLFYIVLLPKPLLPSRDKADVLSTVSIDEDTTTAYITLYPGKSRITSIAFIAKQKNK